MIEIEVKDYCHGCYKFEPEVERVYGDANTLIQIVRCENADLCDRLAKHIEEAMKKGE